MTTRSHSGEKAEALDWYSKGVAELEKGVTLEIHVEGTICIIYK